MGASENKQLMLDVFRDLSNGDPRPFLEILADGVVWTMIGTTSWSGTVRGKQAVVAEVFEPLRAQLRERYRANAQRFIAEGDYVVVEGRGHNITKAGKAYDNTYCWVYRLADGKVQEVTEYSDTALVTAVLEAPAASSSTAKA